MGSKKRKRNKDGHIDNEIEMSSRERSQSLKLILKVGNCVSTASTDDIITNDEFDNSAIFGRSQSMFDENLSTASPATFEHDTQLIDNYHHHHKKSKKKKKKKSKVKDKDKDKDKVREKRHKHKHKSKRKQHRDESSQDEVSMLDDDCGNESTTYANLVSREPRSCVLKRKNEQTPLQKLLEHLLKTLEKRDPKQFFAYPVTDNIAPGYSKIISHPMDFSTMRQKINVGKYATLQEFISDFKLMCSNAMHYNHSDTIYYKASKKLLHAGLKLMQPEKLGWLLSYISNLTSDELGFEVCSVIQTKSSAICKEQKTESDSRLIINESLLQKRPATTSLTSIKDVEVLPEKSIEQKVERVKQMPDSKFEAIPDDLTPEEILAQVHDASQKRKKMLMAKTGGTPMGFLRQSKDGTTSLAIIVGGDGMVPGTNQRPVLLGSLIGKLNEGSNQLTGFREDRRNQVKTVKPLYYGAFGSYAPSYDSAFANLSKEESELVLQTYGSESAVQYAESLIDFTKDSNYAMRMADSLLDTLTNGEHSRTKEIIDERRKLHEEEEMIRKLLGDKTIDNNSSIDCNGSSFDSTIENIDSVPININELKSLSEIGIDTSFLKLIEDMPPEHERQTNTETSSSLSLSQEAFTNKLNETSKVINKLYQIQTERLSAPITSLENVPGPTDDEANLAEHVTNHLTELAKQVTPSDIVSVAGLRKAMGINMPLPPSPRPTSQPSTQSNATNVPIEVDLVAEDSNDPLMSELESELRQFLESDHPVMIRDDKTIEEIFMT